MREAERARQYEEYKDRVQEIANGLVKRTELRRAHGRPRPGGGGVIRREDLLPRESFRNGDRVRAYIYDVRREPRGPQIFMSRTHPNFMAKLFAQEVPEIYDGIIEIDAVARDPGSRAKIAVHSNDSSIDPVGACVGMRGSRVQAVVGELQGEKIDIIQWSPDPAAFIVNALAPAEVTKVVLDEEAKRIEVVVPDEQLSLAIGRRGQNVRLASNLTGWDIDILTEAEESERRQEEFLSRSEMFMEALDVDEVIAHLLVTEGFSSVEEVAFVPIEELAAIEGFEEELASELASRAQAHVEATNRALNERRIELGVSDEVAAIEGLDPAILVALGEKRDQDAGRSRRSRRRRARRDPGRHGALAGGGQRRHHAGAGALVRGRGSGRCRGGRGGRRRRAGRRKRRRGARESERLSAQANMRERPARPADRQPALHRERRQRAARGAAALRGRPRRPPGARSRREPAGAGPLGHGRARRAGCGLREGPVRPGRAPARRRRARSRRRGRAAAGGAGAGPARACAPRRRAGHRLRQGEARAGRAARGGAGRGERWRPARPRAPRRAGRGTSPWSRSSTAPH